MLARAYSGLGSFVCHQSLSSVVIVLACRMTPDSLLHAFKNCKVCSILPYSCLLLRMCNEKKNIETCRNLDYTKKLLLYYLMILIVRCWL